ncbi:MAG: SPOR domain-containing protein [Bacteroidales bacterium]|nr:SPOR domain-containing protein [Bacteroidales bacterium]
MKMFLTILLAVSLYGSPLLGTAPTDTSGAIPERTPEAELSVPLISSFPTELTVDGLVSLSHGNFVIQMGAFNRRGNAEALRKILEQMLGIAVDVIEEGNMFKVFINSSLRGNAPCLFVPVSFPAAAREVDTHHPMQMRTWKARLQR